MTLLTSNLSERFFSMSCFNTRRRNCIKTTIFIKRTNLTSNFQMCFSNDFIYFDGRLTDFIFIYFFTVND